MGFAALNLFNCGCHKLMEGGLQNLLDKHTLQVEILQEMEDEQQAARERPNPNDIPNSNPDTNHPPISTPIPTRNTPPIPTCDTPLIPTHNAPPIMTCDACEDSLMQHISGPPPLSPTPITSQPTVKSIDCTSVEAASDSESDADSNVDSIVALEDVDELDLYTEKHLLRLEAGPELTPSINLASGRLINEWEDTLDGLDTDGIDGDDDEMENEGESKDENNWLDSNVE